MKSKWKMRVLFLLIPFVVSQYHCTKEVVGSLVEATATAVVGGIVMGIGHMIETRVKIEETEEAEYQLFLSAREGNYNEVVRIIQSGIGPNTTDSNDMTPLMYAALKGHFEIVTYLVGRGANINLTDNEEWNALMYAVYSNHTMIAGYLLESGAQINYQNDQGWNALIIASINGNLELVKLLVEEGAHIDFQDNNGHTALMLAISGNHMGVVEYLLEAGADVQLKDENDITALMFAAYNANQYIIQILLETGADPNQQDNIGATALMIAAKKGYLSIIRMLIQYGANPELLNIYSESAIDIAIEYNQPAVVDFLSNIEDNYMVHLSSTRPQSAQEYHGLQLLSYNPTTFDEECVQDEKIAIIIGIEKYQDDHIAALPYAVKDAESLADLLESQGYVVFLMTSDRAATDPNYPSRMKIERKLAAMENRFEENDQLVFYFCGHGVSNLVGTENYLLPTDADSQNLEISALSLTSLADGIIKTGAGKRILLIDSCRSNPFSTGHGLSVVPNFISHTYGDDQTYIFMATEFGENSYDYLDKEGGVFTFYLLEALEGAADSDESNNISYSEIVDYITYRVRYWAMDNNKRQNPQTFGGAGNPVLVGYE